MKYVLAIDQGTTSTRAIVFGSDGTLVAIAQEEFRQIYPHPGWVEHDPNDLWQTTLSTMRAALAESALVVEDVAAIGITNQRETTLVWSRETGEPICNAIVWQDRRTADLCARLAADGLEEAIAERTGLLLDSYFSATKINWILNNVPGARARAEKGELAFGTVDTYLLWRLTGGAVHATDATNASRTLLFNIRTGMWDDELLRLFDVPRSLLPQVHDTAGAFGIAAAEHLGKALPVLAIAGDQQAALVGQVCLKPGMIKATYGTGGFVLLNTGPTAVRSRNRLVTTIAYQWQGVRHYAIEGSIFVAGAAVKWLRDALGIIASSAQAGELAAQADAQQSVYFVPAFVGLGAPYWNSNARGIITGLTHGTTRKELARAVLESIGYQTRDLLDAMDADAADIQMPGSTRVIRVDGGMSASDWTMQFLADILDAQVDRPTIRETTALGVALLAGWQAGLYPSPDRFSETWFLDRSFNSSMSQSSRSHRYQGWRDAVARTILVP